MNRRIPLTWTALALVLAVSIAGAGQAAPAAERPQPSQRPAAAKAEKGEAKHSFFCNMEQGDEGGAVTGVQTPAIGDVGHKTAPKQRVSPVPVTQPQSQQSGVTPQ